MQIHYLENKYIDKKKWDSSMKEAYNSTLYGFSWYLDVMCLRWDALATDDYKLMMPLPISTRMGKEIVIAPAHVYQLGVFGQKKISPAIIKSFVDAIPTKFKFIDLPINDFNSAQLKQSDLQKHTSYKFDLISEYSKIYEKIYTASFREKFLQTYKAGHELESNIDAQVFLDFFRENNPHSNIDDIAFLRVQTMVKTLVKYGLATIVACFANKKICAAGFFMLYQNNAICLLYAENNIGKNQDAIYLIIDSFIRDNTIKNITFEIVPGDNVALQHVVHDLNFQEYHNQTIRTNRFSLPYRIFMKSR